jgi:hypothetical protein
MTAIPMRISLTMSDHAAAAARTGIRNQPPDKLTVNTMNPEVNDHYF